jgi:hypothetical protein
VKHQVFLRLADELDAHSALLQAIAVKESRGSGFNPDGTPKRLHEGHWFGKLTGYRYNERYPHLSAHTWEEAKQHYKSGRAEIARFNEAYKLDSNAAIQANSWGAFQIMGFHWRALGFNSPQAFADAQMDEAGQIDTFGRFLKLKENRHLLTAIRKRDFRTIARLYNGTGQVPKYSRELEELFNKFLTDEWEDVDGAAAPETSLPMPEVDRSMPAPDPVNTITGATNIAKAGAGFVIAGAGMAEVAEKVENVERVAHGASGIMRTMGYIADFLLSPTGLYIGLGLAVVALGVYGFVHYRKKVHRGEAIAVPLIKGATP